MKAILKQIVVAVLSLEARLVLKRYRPNVVAITGSVGKTGTKDAIFSLLASVAHARKSEKSFNSELGVPLTILGLGNAWSSTAGWVLNVLEGLLLVIRKARYPEWLVLEVGADHPGDIRSLSWLEPHVTVFTRFPNVPVHVEFFSSPEAVIEEKRELKRALRPNGTLIVNADDEHMKDERVHDEQRLLSYGMSEHATVRGKNARVCYEGGRPVGIEFDVQFQTDTRALSLQGTLGEHHTYALLAALAVGVSEGLSFDRCVQSLSVHTAPPGRMRLIEGAKDTTLIDDTYNASPVAVEAALATLGSLEHVRSAIAVLGDMYELGQYSVEAHRTAGDLAAKYADVFIAVGVRMQDAAEQAKASRHKRCRAVYAVKDAREAGELLQSLIRGGDVVLIKGSQAMRMERTVEMLMRDPSQAPTLLVRQDKEWRRKV